MWLRHTRTVRAHIIARNVKRRIVPKKLLATSAVAKSRFMIGKGVSVIRIRFLLATTHTRRRIESIDGVLKGDEIEEKANEEKAMRDAMPTA
jgi:hypothetical protein